MAELVALFDAWKGEYFEEQTIPDGHPIKAVVLSAS
jgi:hypothetical protein